MKKLLSLTLCAALLAAVFPLSLAASAAEGDGEYGMLDEIIIEFFDRSLFSGKEKQYDDEVSKVLKDGIAVVTDNVYVLSAEGLSKNPNAVLNRYKNSKFIRSVEPNYICQESAVPNDPNYSTLKAQLTALNAQNGWDIVKEGGPIVAVVDSGVAQHPDLPALLPGYSAVAGLSPNNDKSGHGTGVAGTLGARGNNGIGTVGINWNAKIMPVKVDDANNAYSVANLAKGIMWAADNGARVISLSISTTGDSVTLKNAVDYAYGKGCAIFASAGNDGKGALNYPARYSNVMAVGATGNATSRSPASNYGPGMGVVAIQSHYTTTAAGGYASMAGTSFSAPQVAGLASLVLALDPNLTNAQVYSYIQQGAKTLGGGYNEQTGYGVIDIGKTLGLVQANTAPPKKDTTPPVLTLLGSAAMELGQGKAFVEPGYTAIDDTDGNITGKVTVTGSVNVNAPGVYRLEYKVSDAAGNTAAATRVVEIVLVDTTPPVLTLKGAKTMTVEMGNAFVEPGYTAIDDFDGDITSKVIVTGTVNTNAPNKYEIKYTVSDKAGNTSSATRTVEVILVDTIPPVLTLKGSPSMTIKEGDRFTEPGYTAVDNVDGDITNKVIVTGSVDTNKPGVYTLTYAISDAAGNASAATRTVEVTAAPKYTLPPTLALYGSMDMQIFVDEDFVEPGYSAADCLGANLTGAVRVTGSVNIWTPGLYTINYEVEDAGGNKARATRTVAVIEREEPPRPANAPILTVIGSDPIILHLNSGTPYTEQGAKAIDEVDGDISGNVQISGRVDRNKAGTYALTYKVANSIGMEATATRTVRILAPNEIASPRQTYNFSGSGKAVSTTAHKNVIADDAGFMDFSVTKIDKNMTIKVEIKNQKTGAIVFSNTYTGVGGTQFWADEGIYDVNVTISAGNGNCSYSVRTVTPEKKYLVFEDDEVPLFSDELILGMIAEGRTPLEICMKFKRTPEELNGYYQDFIASGWTDEDLNWFGLAEILDVETPLADFPKTGADDILPLILLFWASLAALGALLPLARKRKEP